MNGQSYRYEVESDRFFELPAEGVEQANREAGQLLNCCLHIGYKCNLSCPYCFSPFNGESLIRCNIEKIVSFIKREKIARVVISGGEPLLYKEELKEAITKIKEVGASVIVSTNGLLLGESEEYFHILIQADWVDISIPATNSADYHAIRGFDGFDMVTGAVKDLVSRDKRVRLSYISDFQSEEEAELFLSLAASLGVDNVRLGYIMDVSQRPFSRASNDGILQIKEKFGINNIYLPLAGEKLTSYQEGYLVVRFDGALFKNSAIDECYIGSVEDPLKDLEREEMAKHQEQLFVANCKNN